MAPEVISWTGENISQDQRELLEGLFPKKDHIWLKRVKELPKESGIDMINKALRSSNFTTLPERIAKGLQQLAIDARLAMAIITALIKEELPHRTNEPETLETVPNSVWGKFIPCYKHYSEQ